MSNSILINAIGACIMCLALGYLFGFMVFGMPKLPQITDAHIEGQRVFDKHLHTQWSNDQAEQYYKETYEN